MHEYRQTDLTIVTDELEEARELMAPHIRRLCERAAYRMEKLILESTPSTQPQTALRLGPFGFETIELDEDGNPVQPKPFNSRVILANPGC